MLFILNLAVVPSVWAQHLDAATPAPAYREDRILVMPKPAAAIASLHSQLGADVLTRFPGLGGLQTVAVPSGETAATLIAKYQASGLVEYAEPDFFRYLNAAPNDPKYTDGTLWGLHNSGQSGGLTDADIDAPEAWDVQSSASSVVVAVLDTGIRYTHEDLAANMWTNPVDGSFGFNTITGTTNVMDDNGHGTLVSGVLGAVGNNGKGVTGVAWQVQLMAIKCFNSSGGSSDSYIIAGIDYARTNGAHVMVAPFDSPGYSASLSNAIYATRETGIIFVTSVGNNSVNIDTAPRYPACYDIDNVVAVTATTRTDTLLSIANYGATHVDLAAPGESIHTTWSPSDSYYTSIFSGTSYSAPYVAGAFALLKERFPTKTHQELIHRVLNGVDPLPALAGKCATGGRLNLRKALSPPLQLTLLSTAGNLPLQFRVQAGPNRSCVIEASTNLTSWLPVFTNTTSAGGTFDFTDSAPLNSPRQFFRAVSTL